MPSESTTLVGRDTQDTLTNKSMSVGQLTGILPIASGGTGSSTAANARASLEIFNAQVAVTGGNDRTQYSGKIYVADPAIVGASGANLDGAAAGDLWFW
jgi:phage-related tail fiber protein